MKKIYILVALILSYQCFFALQNAQAQSSRSSWFEEARYGMFIHWGLYSAAEGMWKGEQLRYLNNYAEWLRYRNRISKEEYGKLAERFVWDRIDPEEWVLAAKKSGMKYIIMTAKHHDGVALWNTQVGDYSLPKLSGSNRDVIKELAEACRKHDMKLGFYYSHWIDWEHPYAWDHNQELTGHVTDAQFDQYWQEKAIPQLRELLTNYGDIAVMWFDMWIPYQRSIFKKEQLEQAASLIRSLQPNCLINSRLGLDTNSEFVDFETLGDNQFGTTYTEHAWETPGTIAHSWGYNGQEKEWKSTAQLFESLISNVALNGSFTLNIGPRADGSIPFESTSRLNDIGHWLQNYGESVYGNTGLEFNSNRHDWGKLTRKKGENIIYLHVFNWPLDRILRVTGLNSKPEKIELLANNQTQPCSFDKYGPLLHIQLPKQQPDPFVSILKLTFQTIELDKDVVTESTFGGFALTGMNAKDANNVKLVKYDGKRPAHLIMGDEKISWSVYLPEAGQYSIDLSAHNPNDEGLPVRITLAGQTAEAVVTPDGKVVVEPNEKNYVEEFADRRLGEITITQPGKYTLEFQSLNRRPLWLNRLWIIKK
ncbi:alpha-L-fucosidase [Sphingobacterium deserti]|uniref:alpha-L-fucosidase n=1 Tax=Sphingobacterium deserti TaxID=1229276 RepID=A0A0B8T9B9_9SPHI|nr:alpha-L-fucosidase [Sphingobacterium deserti]KGE15314.1 glycoside hydrolase family 29 (alpha-L-fucosidase) [Sphingobacterium deserti]